MVTRRVVGLVLLVLLVGGSLAAQSPEEIFTRGNAAYEGGRFSEAAEAYGSLLRYGIEDPRVEYNLGNAEFRLGRLGRAILHYERAHRLDPTDRDVRANLALARSLIFDRVEEPPVALVVRGVRGMQDRLGPDGQAWIALGLLWGLAALVAWYGSRPGGWTPPAAWVLATLLVLCIAAGSSWYVTLGRLNVPRAVILAEAVKVLAGPGENNATLFTVHEGLTVEVRAERSEWIQVSLPNGLNGWIPSSDVGRV